MLSETFKPSRAHLVFHDFVEVVVAAATPRRR